MFACKKDLIAWGVLSGLALAIMLCAATAYAAAPQGTTLTFEDEFNTFALDTTQLAYNSDQQRLDYAPWDNSMPIWGYQLYAWNWGNYVARFDRQFWTHENDHRMGGAPLGIPLHVLTDSSTLLLRCQLVPDEKRYATRYWGFACAMISTERSHAQKYGSIEVRARLGARDGIYWGIKLVKLWVKSQADERLDPCVTVQAIDANYARVRVNTIVIAEGNPWDTNGVSMGYHYAHETQNPGSQEWDWSNRTLDSVSSSDYIDGFNPSTWHTYSLAWDSVTLTWYVDGVQRKQMANPGFNEYMHYSIEGAIHPDPAMPWGGLFPKQPAVPNEMEVDYVKAWDGTEIPAAARHEEAAAYGLVHISSILSSHQPLVITLSKAVPVNVGIYDMKGRALYATCNAGANVARRIVWNGLTKDGIPAPAGTYLCKVSHANKTVCARVTLMP